MTISGLTPTLLATALVVLGLGLTGCPEPRDTADPALPPEPPKQQVLTVDVHFTRNEEPEPVEREVPRTDAVLRAALEAQLEGPTAEERAAGFFSWFSDETAGMLQRVAVDEEGRAVVDFEDFSRIIPGASTSAGSRILMGELNATVFQFPDVRSVEYRFDGSCDDFFEWLQAGCHIIERPEDVASREI